MWSKAFSAIHGTPQRKPNAFDRAPVSPPQDKPCLQFGGEMIVEGHHPNTVAVRTVLSDVILCGIDKDAVCRLLG